MSDLFMEQIVTEYRIVNSSSGCQENTASKRPRQVVDEFWRYFVAGSLAFGSDFVVLVVLTELVGMNYLVSNLFGFCCGLIVSYLLCIRWVFARRSLSVPVQEFAVFVILALIGLGLNEGVLWAAVEMGGQHYAVAKVLATGAVFMVNFLLKKTILFR